MKTLRALLFLLLFLAVNKAVFSQTYVYLSPKNNSILVSLSTNIILKSNERVDPSSLSSDEFSVTGSVSGIHQGAVKLSDDHKTIMFVPNSQFTANEDVTATVSQGLKTADGNSFSAVTIHFTTTPLSHPMAVDNISESNIESVYNFQNAAVTHKPMSKNSVTDTLPSDFPQITVGTSNNPASGNIFLTNKSQGTNTSIGYYLMIFNNDGSVAKYRKLSQMANLFKMEANGDLSYAYPNGAGGWFILDTSLTTIDTFQCGNGYKADAHDFLLLPNGHALLFANDQEPVDMSQIITGGNPDALVTGLVVQELDASKNVIFQWRSWDYLPITDSYYDLTSQNIDLIHANAIALDTDGNIVVSMRHLSSVVKIDRETGDVLWMLGGKQNDFTFINEHAFNSPTYFSYQHDVSVLPDGDITLFDNGNQHSPNYSRGVEYKLDEQNKIATLVWEYRHTPDIYASSMGSVERLPNGNTIVGWGQAGGGSTAPVFTEVNTLDSTALEFFMPAGQFSYRSYNYQWVSQTPKASVTISNILQSNSYQFDSSADTTGIKIAFNSINASLSPNATVSRYAYSPTKPTFSTTAPLIESDYFIVKSSGINSFTGVVNVDLKEYPAVTNPSETIVYARSDSNNTFVSLATSYDSTLDELTFTTTNLGDFAFGVPQTIDSAYAPVLLSPTDSEIVNEEAPVKLVWGTRGIVQTYRLQVSTNESFSNVVVDNSGLSYTSLSLPSVNNNTTYYWRVNNTNAAGTSSWSNVDSFRTFSPFIKVISPNGGEKVYLDSAYIVRWESNIADTLNVQLLNGNKIVSVIGDSIVSGTNAYQWKVPSTLQLDSTYKVVITSISNTNVSGVSTSTFTISSSVTGVKEINNTVKSYELFQNYPNPFNPTTAISYQLSENSHVTLKVYDILGNLVQSLVSENQKQGEYSVRFNGSNLASGIYFYQLKTDTYVSVKKMVLLK